MKQSGIGDLLLVQGRNVTADVGAITKIGASSDVIDVTSIGSGGRERIYGVVDGEISYSGFWDVAAGRLHEAARNHRTPADRVVTYMRGAGIGRPAAAMVAAQTNYDWSREAGGALSGTVQCLGNGSALDWGAQLTDGISTFASAGSLASVDNGTATSTGWAAYLQVVALASGSPTVLIEESADNGGADPWATLSGASFTGLTAPGAYRLVGAPGAAVERYVRCRVTGTFSGLQIALVFAREPMR